MSFSILILDDNKSDARLMKEYLKRSDKSFGHIRLVHKKESYREALKETSWDLIISDCRLVTFSALEAIRIKNTICEKDVPAIVVSGTIGEEQAVELIREGAVDFLLKEHTKKRLPQVAMRAINESIEKSKLETAEKELKQRKQLLQAMMDQAPAAIYVKEGDGTFHFVNKEFKRLIQQERSELIGHTAEEFINKEWIEKLRKNEQQAIENGEILNFENTMEIKGDQRTFWTSKIPLKNGAGLEEGVCTILTDITERKQAENKLRESLKEKEILLQEIHHRVKNNLAIVSGMMELQAFDSENEEVLSALMSSQSRIQSMSIIHELLYQSESFSQISLDENVARLIDHISSSIQPNCDINLKSNIDDLSLNVNQAIPCTLILNELLTNIYKHAFVGRDKGKIRLSLNEQNQQIQLTLSDNGVGLPTDFSLKEPKTLGVKLIGLLTKQLDGELSYQSESGNGTKFILQFEKKNTKGSASNIIDKTSNI